ncbi:hypothetical protein C0991_003475 [Blastosporella zonata]|nr:hypothetical protein C0991_003475 [Blastosporella zonata]
MAFTGEVHLPSPSVHFRAYTGLISVSGYVFDSAETISPYLEEPKTGPSSRFCQEIAKHLGCYVAGGYPERLSEEERRGESESPTDEAEPPQIVSKETLPAEDMEIPPSNDAPGEQASISTSNSTPVSRPRTVVGANSAIIYGPTGEWVGGYRKTNLFETDTTWAKPGTGFVSFSLPLTTSSDVASPLDISLGICMDLNPHSPNIWTSDKGPYELADHCVKNQSRLLVLLNAWLYSGLDEDGEKEGAEEANLDEEEKEKEVESDQEDVDSDEGEPDWYTLRYWTARLEPLWRRDGRRRGSNETVMSGSSNGSGSDDRDRPEGEEQPVVEEAVEEEEEEEEKPPHETIVVVCNRTGKENGKTFAGSSAIFSMRAGSGRPKLLDMMGKDEEGVRVWNLLV